MFTEYLCKLCNLEVKNDDDSIQCDLCDKSNRINCENVRKKSTKIMIPHGDPALPTQIKCLFQRCETMI